MKEKAMSPGHLARAAAMATDKYVAEDAILSECERDLFVLAFRRGAEWRHVRQDMNSDWTVGPDGRSNTSDTFEDVVLVMANILRSHRLGDDVHTTARLVIAQLAHNHDFAPRQTEKEGAR